MINGKAATDQRDAGPNAPVYAARTSFECRCILEFSSPGRFEHGGHHHAAMLAA